MVSNSGHRYNPIRENRPGVYTNMTALFKNRQLGIDLFIISVLGAGGGLLLGTSAVLPLKWMAFGVTGLLCLAVVFIIPQREKFFLYSFVLAQSIYLDYHLVYLESTPFAFDRPVYGVSITLADIPFAFLLVCWAIRLNVRPQNRVKLYPRYSIPFGLIIAISLAGMLRTFPTRPDIISFWSFFLLLKGWLIFIYIANNIRDRRTLYTVMAVFIASMAVQCFIGLAQHFSGKRLGIAAFGEAAQSFFVHRHGLGTISRVGGTLGSPNRLAGYMDLSLPVTLALALGPLGKKRYTFLLLSVFLLGCYTELLTYSRSGWAALFVALSLFAYWYLTRKIEHRIISITVAVLLAVCVSAFVLTFADRIKHRLFDEDYGAAKIRLPLMAVAADTIGHHPWLGVGLSKYGEGAALYDKTPEGVTFSFRFPVHNEFMLIAAELGLPALALFLSVLGMSLGQLFRIAHSRDDPLMPYLAAGIFCGWVAWSLHHQVEYNYALFLVRIWLFFGLAQAMAEILNTGQKRASV